MEREPSGAIPQRYTIPTSASRPHRSRAAARPSKASWANEMPRTWPPYTRVDLRANRDVQLRNSRISFS